MIFFSLLLLWRAALGEDCECTGSNEGLPPDTPHFGTEFGKYCSTWDKKSTVCVEDDPPEWCNESWCYVKEGCTLEWEGKTIMDAKPSTYKRSGLFYSYRVCGSKDWFDDKNFEYNFKGCEDPRTEPIDVYFLVDGSGSISPTEWQQQNIFLSKIIEHGLNVDGDRFGIVQFSGRYKKEFGMNEFELPKDVALAQEKIAGLVQKQGGTKTAPVIQYGINQLKREGGKNRKVLILLTDGIPDDGSDPCHDQKSIDLDLKGQMGEAGIRFGILGIGDLDFENTLGCITDDPKKNVVVMQDFDHLYEYRDPTPKEGEGDLMCIDPNVFTRPEEDNSCGDHFKIKGKNSKKRTNANRVAVMVLGGGSCECKQKCLDMGKKAFSFRKKKADANRRSCVCFDAEWTEMKPGGKKSQIMGLTY